MTSISEAESTHDCGVAGWRSSTVGSPARISYLRALPDSSTAGFLRRNCVQALLAAMPACATSSAANHGR